MKYAVLALGLLTAGAAAAADAPSALVDPQAQSAYTIGFNLGSTLKRDGVVIDPQIVAAGMKDGLAAAAPQLSPEAMRAVFARLQADVKARHDAAAVQAAVTNKAAGAAYLKANGARKGVVTLPSGLQYEILKAGTGRKPKSDDVVECDYRGTLLDGTEFDSSYARGKPATFPVQGVIKGWTEALQLMPEGSKWKLVIPSELAYGDEGRGDGIQPNATLVFEVELHDIQAKD